MFLVFFRGDGKKRWYSRRPPQNQRDAGRCTHLFFTCWLCNHCDSPKANPITWLGWLRVESMCVWLHVCHLENVFYPSLSRNAASETLGITLPFFFFVEDVYVFFPLSWRPMGLRVWREMCLCNGFVSICGNELCARSENTRWYRLRCRSIAFMMRIRISSLVLVLLGMISALASFIDINFRYTCCDFHARWAWFERNMLR